MSAFMSAFAHLFEISPATKTIFLGIYEFFEIAVGIVVSFIILRERPKLKVYPYLCVALCCITYGILYLCNFTFRVEIGYVMSTFLPLVIFPLSKNKSYKYCIVSFFSNLGSGILIALIITMSAGNYNDVSDSLKLVYSLIVTNSLFVILLTISNVISTKSYSESLIAKMKLPMLFLIMMTVTLYFVTLIHFQINLSSKPNDFYLSLLNIALLTITIIYTVRNFLKTKLAESRYKNQLELQIQQFELLEEKNNEIRIFRHDMPKKLRPLAMYLEEKNYEDAKSIVDEFNIAIENSRLGFDTGNYMLDTVLESEHQLAKKQNITIRIVPGSIFPGTGIAAEDIYTIFPNAFDNAIEACAKVEDNREITFESIVSQGKVYIKISNPFTGILKTRNGKPISTKRDFSDHGYGFSSMKKAAAKYGSNNVSFSAADGVYTLSIALKLPETSV